MFRKIHFFILLMCCAFAKANTSHFKYNEELVMPCAILSSPTDGQTNVLVESTINWTPETDVFGYSISLGTTPGGTDIANNVSVGVTPAFTPPLGLPESTTIYVTITVLIDQTTSIVCDEQSFTTINVTTIPGCTQLNTPANNALDVPINTFLIWQYAARATGYILNLGTTPGGTDVINNEDVGNTLSYNIPFDLDPNTTYYASIIPYNENGETAGCTETIFTTENIATEPPPCTEIITPQDGAIEVALTPILSWIPVPEAEGYLITVGTSPDATDVLDNADLGNVTSTAVLDFNEGTLYYVVISPYNAAGVAENCNQTSFTTTLGCGPYTDPVTEEIVDLNPLINLEDSYLICVNDEPLVLTHSISGDSYEWVRVVENNEITISTTNTVTIDETGIYRLYVSEEVLVEAGIIECTSVAQFEVIQSEGPTIENVSFQNQGVGTFVNVIVSGVGDYEYALGSIDGPYQNSPQFMNVPFSNFSIYVRDKNGCGTDTFTIDRDPGFPKYFTPNDDGINDYWQVRGIVVNGQTIESIEIYDRYGKRITTISPFSLGWDGTLNGERLLDAGFWYKATSRSGFIFTGHFALRR